MYDREMHYDGRRLPPRNSRGEFRRRRRGDRGMDYGYDIRGGRVRTEHGRYPMDDRDMTAMHYRGQAIDRGEYHDMPMGDGHYMHGGRQGGYEPVEFMGYCSGYYGSPDHGEYRGRDYGDMRGRRDYGYDYGYGDYGDYGTVLSDEELKRWEHRLMSQLDDREKQMFHKDTIMQKAKSMGKPMEGFGEKELYCATLMVYTDYKEVIGASVDTALRLAFAWLADKDVAVRGAEKLATYYDCIVEGE